MHVKGLKGCVSEENCRSKCKLNSITKQTEKDAGTGPAAFEAKIEAETEAKEEGTKSEFEDWSIWKEDSTSEKISLQRRLHFREDWVLRRTFSFGK